MNYDDASLDADGKKGKYSIKILNIWKTAFYVNIKYKK